MFKNNNIYVVDFETTTINTNFWRNQELKPHPTKPNEFVKIPRVVFWALRSIDFEVDGTKNTPIYYYDFIENKKAPNSKQTKEMVELPNNEQLKNLKEVRGKRQDEAYEFKGFVVGNSEKSFMDFILNLNHNSLFIFHNLSFDGTYIIQMLKELREYGFDQVHYTSNNLDDNGIALLGREMIKTNKGYKSKLKPFYWDVFRNGNEIYKIEIAKKGVGAKYVGNTITIEFTCSAHILSNRVEDLGQTLASNGELFNGRPLEKFYDDEKESVKKLDKSERGFYDVEPRYDMCVYKFFELNKAYCEYCLRDVEIVVRSLRNLNKVFNEFKGVSEYNNKKIEKNKHIKKYVQGTTKHNQYKTTINKDGKEVCEISIYEFLTIAGLMRHLMEHIYVKKYQEDNMDFSPYNVWRHLIDDIDMKEFILREVKKTKKDQVLRLPTYKTLTKITPEDHTFTSQVDDFYNNGLILGLYRGGFTQFNSKYQIELENLRDIKDGIKVDVSSAYPFQMTKPLPFGRIISKQDFERDWYYLKDQEGRQVYINDVGGLTYEQKHYSNIDNRFIKSTPIKIGGYKDLLNNKDKYAKIYVLKLDWIEPKTKEEEPTQFTRHCPFFPCVDKDTYKKILCEDKDINDTYNSFLASARYEAKRQENIVVQLWDKEWEFTKKYYNFKLAYHNPNDDNEDGLGIETYYVLTTPFLRDMSEELYFKKDEYGSKGDASGKLSTKIALNSSYGSLAIKPQFDTTCYVEQEQGNKLRELFRSSSKIKDVQDKKDALTISFQKNKDSEKINQAILKGHSPSIKTNYEAFSLFEIMEKQKAPYNVLAASYITALQRLYLLETIERIGPQYFAYSDTDSIIFCNLDEDVRKSIMDLSNERPNDHLNIGSWEVEIYKLIGFHTTKAKDYVQIYKPYDVKAQSYYNEETIKGHFNEQGEWVKKKKIKHYCSYEECNEIHKFVSSGINLKGDSSEKSKVIKELKMLTIKERRDKTDEYFDNLFSCFSEEEKNDILDKYKNWEEFYNTLRCGGLYIPQASLERTPYIYENGLKVHIEGGTILNRKTKIVQYGKQ